MNAECGASVSPTRDGERLASGFSSERGANWLLYGVQPEDAKADLIPGPPWPKRPDREEMPMTTFIEHEAAIRTLRAGTYHCGQTLDNERGSPPTGGIAMDGGRAGSGSTTDGGEVR